MAATDGLKAYTKQHVTIEGPAGVYVGKELDKVSTSITSLTDTANILGGYAANSAVVTGTFLGNISGGNAVPVALTATQVTAHLDLFTQTAQGLVPAPGTATGTNILYDTGWGAQPAAPNLTPYMQKANNLSDVVSAATSRTNLGLGSAAVLTAGTAANNAVQLDGSAHLPAVDGSALTNLPSQPGRLIAGTATVMSPVSLTFTTTAHGLGAIPGITQFYFECLTADGGYSTGDRLYAFASQWPAASADATNGQIHVAVTPVAYQKGSVSTFSLTLANWKAVFIPYKFS